MGRIANLVRQKFELVAVPRSIAAAGGIFYALDTKKVLLAKRAVDVGLKEEGTWSGWGGKTDEGETSEDTVRREADEECGYKGPMTLKLVYTFKGVIKGTSDHIKYDNYLIIVPREFEPELNWENDDYLWTSIDDKLPSPLHSAFAAALSHYKQSIP